MIIWQWLKIRVPNDPQEWSYLVGNHLFGVSIILSHIHLDVRMVLDSMQIQPDSLEIQLVQDSRSHLSTLQDLIGSLQQPQLVELSESLPRLYIKHDNVTIIFVSVVAHLGADTSNMKMPNIAKHEWPD